jgi:ankyrin repeat protein
MGLFDFLATKTEPDRQAGMQASALGRIGRTDDLNNLHPNGKATPARERTPAASELNTALMQACYASASRQVAALLAAGADANADVNDPITGERWNVLTIAVGSSDWESVTLLLAHGADPNAKNRFAGCALSLAAGHGDINSVRPLLERGANPNAIDTDGWTPLMFASGVIEFFQPDRDANRGAICQLLIDSGANPNAVAFDGKTTALLKADQNGYSEIAMLLKSHTILAMSQPTKARS